MAKCINRRVVVASVLMALVAVPPGFGQLAASRDLTKGWSVPPERVPSPASDSCPQVHTSVSDGETPSSDGASRGGKTTTRESLEFQIVQLSPPQLTIGEPFIADLRLKNTGSAAVLVPGVADGSQLTRSPNSGIEENAEERYEVADVSFRLATDKAHHAAIFLTTIGALFADPDDTKTYVSLAPGNWIDIKLQGTVECGAAKCLGPLQADSDGVLTAWWYQRVLTHTVKKCDENHGAYTVREIDSSPFKVVVHNSVKKAESSPRI
jgi:hypothetical protein